MAASASGPIEARREGKENDEGGGRGCGSWEEKGEEGRWWWGGGWCLRFIVGAGADADAGGLGAGWTRTGWEVVDEEEGELDCGAVVGREVFTRWRAAW